MTYAPYVFFSIVSFPRPPGADPPSAERRESSHITHKSLDARIEFDNEKGMHFIFLMMHTVGSRVSYVWVLWIPAYAGMTERERKRVIPQKHNRDDPFIHSKYNPLIFISSPPLPAFQCVFLAVVPEAQSYQAPIYPYANFQ